MTILLVAALAALVTSCTSGPSTTSAPATSERPPVLGSGCGHPPDPGPTSAAAFGDIVQTLEVGGTTRTYRLAVPTSYRSDRPTPLILLFHGSGSNAVQQSAYSKLPAVAGQAGYLVATPDALGGNWDLAAPGTPTGDQHLVAALEADLGARYCVERSRIYAAGISLGSEFSAIVACDPADRIAAVGLVAAEYLLRPCPGQVPVIAFHGTADPIVPYATGATGRSVPGVPVVGAVQNLEAWARLDGCRPQAAVTTPATGITRRVWTGCRAEGSVALYSVHGGGHTWPGSPVALSAAEFGPTTEVISATHLMLDFFRTHSLRGG